jgi:hypothetical protein
VYWPQPLKVRQALLNPNAVMGDEGMGCSGSQGSYSWAGTVPAPRDW